MKLGQRKTQCSPEALGEASTGGASSSSSRCSSPSLCIAAGIFARRAQRGPAHGRRRAERHPLARGPASGLSGPDQRDLRRRRHPSRLPAWRGEPHGHQRQADPRGPAATPSWPSRTSASTAITGVDLEGFVRALVDQHQCPADHRGLLDHHHAAGGQPLPRPHRHLVQAASSTRWPSPGSSSASTPRTRSSIIYLNTVYFGSNAYGVEAAARPTSTRNPWT